MKTIAISIDKSSLDASACGPTWRGASSLPVYSADGVMSELRGPGLRSTVAASVVVVALLTAAWAAPRRRSAPTCRAPEPQDAKGEAHRLPSMTSGNHCSQPGSTPWSARDRPSPGPVGMSWSWSDERSGLRASAHLPSGESAADRPWGSPIRTAGEPSVLRTYRPPPSMKSSVLPSRVKSAGQE